MQRRHQKDPAFLEDSEAEPEHTTAQALTLDSIILFQVLIAFVYNKEEKEN
jgi:hypothetical protein